MFHLSRSSTKRNTADEVHLSRTCCKRFYNFCCTFSSTRHLYLLGDEQEDKHYFHSLGCLCVRGLSGVLGGLARRGRR